MTDLRTSVVAVVLWGAALLLIHVPRLAGPTIPIALIGAVLLVILRRRGAGLVVLVLLCGAGLAATVAAAQPARDAGHPQRIAGPMRVGVAPIDGADLGAVLRVTGQGKRTDAGERAALVLFGVRAEVTAPASGVFAVAATTRAESIQRASGLPEPGAGLLPGLAVGDTRAVSEEVSAAMLASGLSHLTAVSGADFRHRSRSS
ncbi:hypothetical protein [Microbacterium sp. AR7-10]|uniref:hypothetical protein n=1 Tax=Microbacterium sp. AR7-10 TaxID=1891970 RepID=UPI0008FCB82A|nr:hypothetical protein [Microbacterium sp. AR7-10]OIU87695.1 hypothetical protein BFN01_08140 [Microbacterium sp. AR7-10]